MRKIDENFLLNCSSSPSTTCSSELSQHRLPQHLTVKQKRAQISPRKGRVHQNQNPDKIVPAFFSLPLFEPTAEMLIEDLQKIGPNLRKRKLNSGFESCHTQEASSASASKVTCITCRKFQVVLFYKRLVFNG